MKHSRKNYLVLAIFVIIAATIMGSNLIVAQEKQQEAPFLGKNYLYIEEFEIATGQVPNEAIAETQEWVKKMRETGEFKSVKLYIHNTGPRLALYILAETESWQSIETGFEKLFAALPDFMDKPYKFGSHSDNLLSEIPVE